MKTTKRSLTIFLLAAATSFSCAKERKIERKVDLDGNRWAKSHFQKTTPYLGKVTVVRTSARPAFAFVGMQSEMRAGYFEFTRDKLLYKSAVSVYENDITAGDLINSWEITHSQYRLAESGGRVTNREEEDNTISWQKKNYFKVHWDQATISESASFPLAIESECWDKRDTSLVEDSQRVSDEHITFTLAVDYQLREECIDDERYANGDFTHTVHYKYSFKPMAESDYQPYLYAGESDPLMSKYGYFQTVQQGLDNRGLRTNKFLMNRWHPRKTHTYYFVPGFPNEYKWIFNDPERGVIAKTNKLMADNGLDVRFEIKDSDGSQQFGDVGLSFINFVTPLDEGAPLGYGPQDTNPFTGEIIAAQTLVWTGFLKYYVQTIQEELDREANLSKNSSIVRFMRETLGQEKSQWAHTSSILSPDTTSGQYFRFLLPQYTYGHPGFNRFTHTKEADLLKVPSAESFMNYMAPANRDAIASMLKRQENAGRNRLREIIQQEKNPRKAVIYDIEHPLNEARGLLLNGKSEDEIINSILYRVSIHEFGHNLGLRHNFYGSIDKAHFNPPVEGEDFDGQIKKFEQKTSSVMDYMDVGDELHFNYGWEQYDEAAILYAYSDGNVDLTKKKNTTYLFCTDEHTVTNAMCNRFDSGTTPSEVIFSLIEQYDDSYWVRNFRRDRPYWRAYRYDNQIFQTMWNIKKFLKLHEDTFGAADVALKLAPSGLSATDKAKIAADVQKDIKQSLRLALAFYDAVVQQSTSDRPFKSTFNPWSGALEQLGIGTDKMLAMMFLMGDMALPYDPNKQTATATFFDLIDDDELGPLAQNVINRAVTAPGPMFLGYESFTKVLYLSNASSVQQTGGSTKVLDRLKMVCYRPETLTSRLKVTDAAQLASNGFKFTYKDSTDPNFGGTGEAVALKINGNFYVASKGSNSYAAEMLGKGLGGESSLARTQYDAAELYNMYYRLTLGHVPDCQ